MISSRPGGRATSTTVRGAEEIRLITTLAVCAALVFLNRNGISYLFPSIKPDLQLSNVQLGQLMAATSLAWGISSVGCSVATDALRLRPRLVIVICTLGFSLVGILSGLVSSFPALLALRVAMGVFEGPVIPLIQATVVSASPGERRGANLGIIIGGASLVGSVLSPALMTGLAETIGWRMAFVAIAGPAVVVAFGVWHFTRSVSDQAASAAVEKIGFKSALQLVTQRNVLIGAIGAVTLIGSMAASAAFLPLYLNTLGSFDKSLTVLVLTGLGVTHSVGGILMPAISDRFGRRSCGIIACAGALLAPLTLALMSVSIWWGLPALLFGLFTFGAFTLMVYIIPGEAVPASMVASTYAVLLFFGELLGGSVAPTLAGWFADRHGLMAAQLVATALAGVAMLAAFFVRDAPAPAGE